jgi:predicted ATPase
MKWQESLIAMPFKSKLTSIGVGRFKSIKDIQLPSLNPINVFIGANGAGKSNLVSLFLLLKAIANGKLQEFVGRAGGADSLLYYGAKATSMIWIALKFEFKTGPGDYFMMLASTATDSLVFSQERINYSSVNGSHPLSRQLGSGHRESLLLTDGNDYREIADCLSSIGVFHFHDTSETAPIRRRCYIADSAFLRPDGGNLAAFLYALKKSQPSVYQRILGAIRLIAPFFDDFDLTPLRDDANSVMLNWRDTDSDHLFGPHQLSDGTLRAMALVALLAQPTEGLPSVMVLDEPEIGLHPYAIEVVADLMRSASAHCPIILATQSVALVNHFTPEDIVTVTRAESQSKFTRQSGESLKEWLDDYSVGELWEKNLIGGTPSR